MTTLAPHPPASSSSHPSSNVASSSSGSSPPMPIPGVTTAIEENRWLAATFQLTDVENEDFYTMAKQQYKMKRYHICIKCLEIYIGRLSMKQPPPPATSVKKPSQPFGKFDHQMLAVASHSSPSSVPSTSASTSTSSSTSLPVGPFHLLAYSHYRLGSLARARECFLACVRLGYDADWQMIVQIELELREELKEVKAREERDGQQAIETIRKHMRSNWYLNKANPTPATNLPPNQSDSHSRDAPANVSATMDGDDHPAIHVDGIRTIDEPTQGNIIEDSK